MSPTPPGSNDISSIVAALRDSGRAERPDGFPRDRRAASQPGLYSWWADREGLSLLSDALKVPLESLIYAGQAGATKWPSGKQGTGTLYSRIRGQHIMGGLRGSTFRITLAAVLYKP